MVADVQKTLQTLLNEKQVKQVVLAKELNLSEAQVSLLVAGKRSMKLEVAAVFARKLQLSLEVVDEALRFAKSKASKKQGK